MFSSQVVKNGFGQHYLILLSHQHQGALVSSSKAELFTNNQSCFIFVNSLQVPWGFWQNLAITNSMFSYSTWRQANPWAGIEEYALQALFQGSLRVYKVSSQSHLHQTIKHRQVTDKHGYCFQIQPANNALLNPTLDIKTIDNIAEATDFIRQFNLDDSVLIELVDALNIDILSKSNNNITADLIKALVNGDLVVSKEPEPCKPKSGQDFFEHHTPANEILGPQVSSNSTTSVSKDITPKKPQENKKQNNSINQNETAAGLVKAAEQGVPFCQECEKESAA